MDSVELVNIESSDFLQVAEWLSNPKINSWLAEYWRNPISSRHVAVVAKNKSNQWFMVKHNGEKCGIVALSDIEKQDKVAMIWYFVGDIELKSKGIMSSAIGKAVNEAFGDLDLDCLYAWVMEDNIPSLRVLEKNGFRVFGTLPSSVRIASKVKDRIFLCLNKHQDFNGH